MSTERELRFTGAQGADERFRLIFETAFQFIGLLDAEGRMLEVNRSALTWAHSPRESAVGHLLWDTPWWVNAGDAVLDRLKTAVAAARRGEFVRYDVTLPSLDGPAHTFDFSLTPVADNSGQIVLLVAEGRDITEQRRLEAVLREANQQLLLAQEQANRLAITDFLTALYNRRGFFILAEQQKRLALRTHARGLLIFIDMDDLKRANDQYGHEAGDALIVGAATVLTRAFRASDLVARLGGDEFAVLTSLSAGDSAAAFTNRLVSHIDTFNGEGGLPMPLRMSIGMHEFEWTPDLSLDALPARADAAMYEQKRSNKEKLPADSRG